MGVAEGLVVVLCAVVLIVVGARDRDASGSRTKAGRVMLAIGAVLIASSFLFNISDLIEGIREGWGAGE